MRRVQVRAAERQHDELVQVHLDTAHAAHVVERRVDGLREHHALQQRHFVLRQAQPLRPLGAEVLAELAEEIRALVLVAPLVGPEQPLHQPVLHEQERSASRQ